MVKRYNNLSFLYFIPGMIAQLAGLFLKGPEDAAEPPPVLAFVLLLGGTALCITGFAYYAKAKGRNPAWGAFGFLGIIGLLVLASLKDRSGDPWNT
jgi:hypothetical protein